MDHCPSCDNLFVDQGDDRGSYFERQFLVGYLAFRPEIQAGGPDYFRGRCRGAIRIRRAHNFPRSSGSGTAVVDKRSRRSYRNSNLRRLTVHFLYSTPVRYAKTCNMRLFATTRSVFHNAATLYYTLRLHLVLARFDVTTVQMEISYEITPTSHKVLCDPAEEHVCSESSCTFSGHITVLLRIWNWRNYYPIPPAKGSQPPSGKQHLPGLQPAGKRGGRSRFSWRRIIRGSGRPVGA